MDNPVMTNDEFKAWVKHQAIPVTKLAELLGVSRNSLYQYMRGDAEVPKAISLACAAITIGVREYPLREAKPVASQEQTIAVLAAPFSIPMWGVNPFNPED